MPARRERVRPTGRVAGQGQTSDFCTVAETAKLLGVSVSTVWRWVDAGKLPAFRVGPKSIRIRRSDAEAAVQPVLGRSDVTMTDTVFVDASAAVRPLSRGEKERGLAALIAAEALGEEIIARRSGKPLSGSAAIVRAAREARSRRV